MNIATAPAPIDLLDDFERRLTALGWVLYSSGGGVADWLPGNAGPALTDRHTNEGD